MCVRFCDIQTIDYTQGKSSVMQQIVGADGRQHDRDGSCKGFDYVVSVLDNICYD